MSAAEVIDGLLKPDGTLELEEKLTLPPGRVRVTVEPIGLSPKQDVWTVLEEIWQERKSLGMQGRTRAEIDAQIRTMRDEWDDAPAREAVRAAQQEEHD